MARPPIKDPEQRQDIVDRIFDHFSSGKTLKQIEKLPGMPSRWTFWDWMRNNPDMQRL